MARHTILHIYLYEVFVTASWNLIANLFIAWPTYSRHRHVHSIESFKLLLLHGIFFLHMYFLAGNWLFIRSKDSNTEQCLGPFSKAIVFLFTIDQNILQVFLELVGVNYRLYNGLRQTLNA